MPPEFDLALMVDYEPMLKRMLKDGPMRFDTKPDMPVTVSFIYTE